MRLAIVAGTALLLMGCAAETDDRGAVGAAGLIGEDVTASMEVKVSESAVRMILHVTNTGDQPIEFTFPTSQRYDFVVTTRSGEEVWRWSEGMGFLQALSRATLAPGESWDMEGMWDPESRTGQYVATGVLTAREKELRQDAAFELR